MLPKNNLFLLCAAAIFCISVSIGASAYYTNNAISQIFLVRYQANAASSFILGERENEGNGITNHTIPFELISASVSDIDNTCNILGNDNSNRFRFYLEHELYGNDLAVTQYSCNDDDGLVIAIVGIDSI